MILAVSLACAPRVIPVVAPARLAPDVLAARLAEADRLALRGCYLCLKEAAAAYAALLAETDDQSVATKALENNLMLALREVELRIPDSGAYEAARQLQDHVGANYLAYFAVIEKLRPAETPILVRGEPFLIKQQFEERLALVKELETHATVSAMRAHFYLMLVLQTLQFRDIKAQVDAVVAAHPQDLGLQYRMLAFQPTYSADGARSLIGKETGFGEVHFLIGQRAVLNGNLPVGYRELTRARELLPDSASVALSLANVTFSYARYADALKLFDEIAANPVAVGLKPQAQFGRAKSLSYLGRHDEAIAQLTEVMQNDPRTSPGEKYYWRGWNQLQLAKAQLAYNDAKAGLDAMRNDAIYRLAGMASFALNRPDEARTFFQEALKMNSADCDSERYLGLLESAERSWKPAFARFSAAASCYEVILGRLREELAEYEKDITGLSNGLITAKRVEIREAEALRVISVNNANAATRNAGGTK